MKSISRLSITDLDSWVETHSDSASAIPGSDVELTKVHDFSLIFESREAQF